MNILRKIILLLIILFLEAWLWIPLSYSIQAECYYCLQNDCFHRCTEKEYTDQLFLSSKGYPQGNDYYYVHCRDHNINEILFSWIYLEDEDALSHGSNISEGKVSLSKEIRINHPDNKSTSKISSLFLLKTSFLL